MKRRRLYYIAPALSSTVAIAQDLENMGVGYDQVHVLGKNEDGLARHHVHTASPLETYDMIHMGEQGALIGFILGFIFVIGLKLLNPFDVDINNWILIAVWALITLHGAWSGGIAGTQTRNYKIKSYLPEIEKGKYLLLIDVNEDQHPVVRKLMKSQHPDAEYRAESTTGSNPFERFPLLRRIRSH